jgi:hypothetical protein
VWNRDEGELARILFELICAPPHECRDAVFSAAERIHAMGCERGRNAILNAAPNREDIAAIFDILGNDYERAGWAYISDRNLFQKAEELHFFDHRAEGQLGRGFHGPKGGTVSRDPADLDTFEEELQVDTRATDHIGVLRARVCRSQPGVRKPLMVSA